MNRGCEILLNALGDDALGASISKGDIDGLGRAGRKVACRRRRLCEGRGDGGGAGLLRGDDVGGGVNAGNGRGADEQS